MKAVVARQQPMTLTTRDPELHGPTKLRGDAESKAPQLLSDAELLRLMAVGDEAAFVALYQRHQGPVYRFALLMSGATNIAEEVTQEVFLAMIREPNRYDTSRGPLSAYLYGVARNHVLRLLKRERTFVQLMDETGDEVPSASFISQDDPFGDLSRSEVIRLVRQAVLSLPPRYREVVVLCDFQELSSTDAAVALDCPVGTVNSRLHRAHSLLVKKLRRHTHGAAANAELRCFA